MAKLKTYAGTKTHQVVSPKTWLAARVAFLKKEKKFTRLRDELNRARRRLPWVKVDKEYTFDTPAGPRTLAELFDGQRQLIIYQFMFGPDWPEGCAGCSFWADNFNGLRPHLRARDTNLIAVSRTSLKKIAAFQKRMGWGFPWVSSLKTDYNYDFQASARPEEMQSGRVVYNYQTRKPFADGEFPGISVFYKDGRDIYHTYSTYGRGLDMLNTGYHYLDLTPKGRDEDPAWDNPAQWFRLHDEYKA
jgi:predicted dithiol-disulfide oxidoreductase (DUF899 family)